MFTLGNRKKGSLTQTEVDEENPLPVYVQLPPALTKVTHTAITVATSATTLLNPNPSRRFMLLVNDSDTDIYVTLDGSVPVANTGVRINANGGSLDMSRLMGSVSVSAIRGINAVGNKTMLVTEGV